MTANIAGINCFIEVEILKQKSPLLLGKNSLKKAGTVLDIANDKAKPSDKDFNLYFSTIGHYCIDIFPIESVVDSTKEILFYRKNYKLLKESHTYIKSKAT